MNEFKTVLQQEFLRRSSQNPSYSLRAFARQLNLSHATVSGLLSGKRKITAATVLKLKDALSLGPSEVAQFLEPATAAVNLPSYKPLAQDVFAAISEWHFDAILELAQIEDADLSPEGVAEALEIPVLKARLAIETLVRLKMLTADETGRLRCQQNYSTNDLDFNFTNSAQRRYQRSVLEKSLEALESIPRPERDHTSVTMAIAREDLPQAKELIRRFRQELNALMQNDRVSVNEVYQLQVSFFPLTRMKTKE